MKKAMRFLNLAILFAMGTMIAGCADVEKTENVSEVIREGNTLILTTVVGKSDNSGTKALTAEGVKTFAVGEKLAIVYATGPGSVAQTESHALTADDLIDGGRSAKFTFEVEYPYAGGKVKLIYPASMMSENPFDNPDYIDYSKLNKQDGKLETLAAQLDLATFEGTLTETGGLPDSPMLTNQLAVIAYTLKEAAAPNDLTATITDLTINDGTNSYAVTRAAAAGPIYVAIRPVTSVDINYTATNGPKIYAKYVKNKTYAAGNFYQLGLGMVELASYRMAAEATAEDKGKLICAQGPIHAHGEDAKCTAARVAMIAYVGNGTDSWTYTHGLALALTEENPESWLEAKDDCEKKTAPAGTAWKLPSWNHWGKNV